MVSKSKQTKAKTKHVHHTDTHIVLKKGIVVYALLVFIIFVLTALSVFTVVELKKAVQMHQYEQEVIAMYESLDLDETYQTADINIAGINTDFDAEKITSTVSYGRDASRPATFDDIEKHMNEAGYSKVASKNADTVSRKDYYKNADDNQLIVSITTVGWRNAFTYGTELPDIASDAATTTGPVYVTIEANTIDK